MLTEILLIQGTLFNKARSLAEAKKHLKRLSNKTHKLISGTVIAKKYNKIVWKHRSEARMSMHKLSEKDIDDYLSATGKKNFKCIGAYNIEGFFLAQIFSKRLMEIFFYGWVYHLLICSTH